MTTAANNAITIARVFQRHGIHIGIGAPIIQIQELAMAANLLGRHVVMVEYRGNTLDVDLHSLRVEIVPRGERWTYAGAVRLETDLPNATTPEDERSACIQRLVEIAETLSTLLAEEDPS